jgi:hypothetical protein
VGLAFGGKPKDVRLYVENLRRASGQKEREQVSTKKASNPGSIFAGLAGLGSIEQYKAELSSSTH